MEGEKDIKGALSASSPAGTAVTPGMQAKLPPLARRYTKEQLEEVLERNCGVVTACCNVCDCTYAQFYKALRHYGLLEKLSECRKSLVSVAEDVLLRALSSPDEKVRLDAAKYTLSRLGKGEGWSQDPSVAVAVQVSPGEKSAQIKALFGIGQEGQGNG